MRRLMRMIMEVARENVAHSGLAEAQANLMTARLSEAYQYFDSNLSRDGETPHTDRLAEALVVADFPLYFARTLSRAVEDRYKYMQGQWRDYTKQDEVPDYTTAVRYRFSTFDRLEKRREKQEVRSGYIVEAQTAYSVEDYAKQLDFSNRILTNDDLGAFGDLVGEMGDSGRRFEDFFVSSLYDNALTQAALIALGALYSGTGRLTTANLAIAYNAFVQRLDARGNPLNLVPTYIVGHPILRLAANQILTSEKIAELATNGVNPLRGALQWREDPYITIAPPNIPWYLVAAPATLAAIRVVRQSGKPGIRVYTKAPDKVPMNVGGGLGTPDWRTGSFLTGDIELEVETTIGSRNDSTGALVGVSDANGIYYSSGTTP